jgi:hypothetical protein
MMRVASASLVLSLAAAVSVVTAQEPEIGAKVGPNVALTRIEPPEEGVTYKRRIAVRGGGFAVLPMSRHFAAQFELLFTAKGVTVDLDDSTIGKVLLDYLDVPVLTRIAGPRFGSCAMHVFGGPYVGIRISAKRQVSTTGVIRSGESVDISPDIERFELGALAGAGVNIGRRAVIDARHAWGLTNVNTDTSDGIRIRNRVFTILAGVRF